MMTKVGTVAAAAAIALAALGTNARAEEEEEKKDPIEARVDKLEQMIGFSFGGMIYGSYQYNFNDPEIDSNSLRSLDPEENNFTFDLFQLDAREGRSGGAVRDRQARFRQDRVAHRVRLER